MSDRLQSQLEEMRLIREKAYQELAALPDSALKLTDEESKRSVRQLISMFFSHERNHIVQIEKTRNALHIHPTEVQQLLAQADQSRGDLLASLAGLTDEQWTQKPDEAAWSVQEILDHLMGVENRFLERIRKLTDTQA